MPGLVGFAKDITKEQAKRFLKGMADALESVSRFQRYQEIGKGFGLGILTLGVLDSGPQPAWSEDRQFREGHQRLPARST